MKQPVSGTIFDVKEAAAYLGISEGYLRALAKTEKIGSIAETAPGRMFIRLTFTHQHLEDYKAKVLLRRQRSIERLKDGFFKNKTAS